mmetsp:Transcript_31806/g.93401  ORF Transcript_31806/g.93401 Transcript_31806/m.93401 type:complete len:124 (+) Transcript_31806:40-411(+)
MHPSCPSTNSRNGFLNPHRSSADASITDSVVLSPLAEPSTSSLRVCVSYSMLHLCTFFCLWACTEYVLSTDDIDTGGGATSFVVLAFAFMSLAATSYCEKPLLFLVSFVLCAGHDRGAMWQGV